MDRKITLAIPYYNNSQFIKEAFEQVLNDERINEIIICDDKSPDVVEMEKIIHSMQCSKIKIYKNENNLGCYHNKINTVSKCTNEWCILLDSDNIISTHFIDTLYEIPLWNKTIIYAPSIAETFPGEPSCYLNYQRFVNQTITNEMYISEALTSANFQCLINNCNYFLPVKEYVECAQLEEYERHIIDSLDSNVIFTDWMCKKNTIFVVDNLIYKHRIHSQSNYELSIGKQYIEIVRHQLLDKIKQIM